MTACTFSRLACVTDKLLLSTRDTVAGDTPARWATSFILRGVWAGLTVGDPFEEEPISVIDFKKLTASPGAVKDARRSGRSVHRDTSEPVSYCGLDIWGRSSVGRALAWHARGSGVRFSSPPPGPLPFAGPSALGVHVGRGTHRISGSRV